MKLVKTALLVLLCLAVPFSVFGADKLIVKDSGGTTKFVSRDDGSIMLNTGTYDAPSWTKLFIADNTLVGYSVDSYQNNPTAGAGGLFRFARGSQASKTVVQNGDRLGFFLFSGYDGTTFLNTAGLTAKVDSTVSPGSIPTKLVFETGTAGPPNRQERMVILSNGNVGIGTSTPTHLIQLSGGAFSDGTTWEQGSSRELKENIQALSTEQAMEALKELTPVTYNYKSSNEDSNVGFIAEDVPELVASKGRKSLNAMDIAAVLTKVVQEQRKTIEALQEKINRIEEQISR